MPNKVIKLKALANAKINLHLEVLSKRADGYHDISTIFQSIDLADEIHLTLSDGDGVFVSTENIMIDGENLAETAAEAFLKQSNKTAKVDILIKKNIPLLSGLAGGSADAAAVLLLLNSAFDYPLTQNELLSLGAKLGADIPFCITGGTALAEGIGEKLSPIANIDSFEVVLIKHYKKSSTGAMYGRLDDRTQILPPITQNVIDLMAKEDYLSAGKVIKNSFLDVSDDVKEQTDIIKLLESNGAVMCGLSGSGPTLFALFETINEEFLDQLKRSYNEVYVAKTSNQGIKIIE